MRSGNTDWDRATLIFACRYFKLQGLFDDAFWASLMGDMDHPAEAKSIMPFDREDDIYLP